MAVYDEFAWFYQRYWNEEFHSLALPILNRIWLTRLPAGAYILDICCGTGYLAALLLDRGYQIDGFDTSEEMLRYAREKAPSGHFRLGDAASYRPTGSYDAAVSTFDSLNHILKPEALEAVFRNTAAALKPGGWFAFDMLLEKAYQTTWGENFALVRDDHVLTITKAGYDFRTRIACCTITMFRLVSNVWRRSDVLVQERCYTLEEIRAALDRAGFVEATCHDAADLGMSGQLGEGRTFFVARKN